MSTELKLNEGGFNNEERRYSQLSRINMEEPEGDRSVIYILIKVMIICTVFMLIELVGGYWANSIAVISDALHLTIDIIGYIIQVISAGLALKKSVKHYHFGYKRAEAIGALINCVTIWILTCYLVWEAVKRLVHPPEYFEQNIMLITASFGVLANILMAVAIYGCQIIRYMCTYAFMTGDEKNQIKLSDGSENLNLRAVMAHIQGDLVYAIGVLIAAICIVINPTWKFIDPVCTLCFSIIVLKITVPVCRDSMRIIMESVPGDIDEEAIKAEISRRVSSLEDIKIWSVTQDYNVCMAHCIIEKNQDEQVTQHEIGNALKELSINYWTIQLWKKPQQVCFKGC